MPTLTVLCARCHGLQTPCSTLPLVIQRQGADARLKLTQIDQYPLTSLTERAVLLSLMANVALLTAKFAPCHGPLTLHTSSQSSRILTVCADVRRKDNLSLTLTAFHGKSLRTVLKRLSMCCQTNTAAQRRSSTTSSNMVMRQSTTSQRPAQMMPLVSTSPTCSEVFLNTTLT